MMDCWLQALDKSGIENQKLCGIFKADCAHRKGQLTNVIIDANYAVF